MILSNSLTKKQLLQIISLQNEIIKLQLEQSRLYENYPDSPMRFQLILEKNMRILDLKLTIKNIQYVQSN